MLQYIVRRLAYMIPTLIAISMVTFFVIQLPPGDFTTSYITSMSAMGESIDQTVIDKIKDQYGFNDPVYIQYGKWMWGILSRGDFGRSFELNRPVKDLIWERLALTFIISLAALLFTWIMAFPIGIYSAVKQYSLGDYFFTFLGFLGLATPNFMVALVLMYIAFKFFGMSVGGLFSPDFIDAPWSMERALDLANHLWIPVIILGTDGTAGLIRVMRANLLDELRKPYVVTARAKGLSERRVLIEYPVRVALNPWLSSIAWVLPHLISGATILSVVLNLPTTGPMQLRALMSQDMYLAGSFILLLSVLTVIGTLVSDILLAWFDPRIRYR